MTILNRLIDRVRHLQSRNINRNKRGRTPSGLTNRKLELLESRCLLAATLDITVENLARDGGLYQTPFWVGIHDGQFDVASMRRAASEFPGLELLAEEGDTSEFSNNFRDNSSGTDTTITAPGGFGGAPVFDPGESVTTRLVVSDPATNRYLSYASMVIPSNDAFLANLRPTENALFNRRGHFRGPLTLTLYGRDVLDAGTEVNDPRGGAAFSTGGGNPQDENGFIHRHLGLDEFVGTGLPTGEDLQRAFGNRSPIARISVSLAPVQLDITVENLSPDGGLYETPFWIGAHDGKFDVASKRQPASKYPGLELLAEEGDTSEFSQNFHNVSSGIDTTIVAPDGFPGAPVFDPGDVVTSQLEIDNPATNRFLSYASMVIPSNDAFLANLRPKEHKLFDRHGNFRSPRPIIIYGRDVLDAGTEVNDPRGGAAFSTEGGDSNDENGVIRRHKGLDDFVGTGLPTGDNLETAFKKRTPLARITVSLPPVELAITIENLSSEGGLYQTPFWVGLHDGTFEVAAASRPASRYPGLELLAEEGDTSELSRNFHRSSNGIDTTIVAPGGFAGAPVFDPGEVVTSQLLVENPAENRFLSFASMVIPSNDAFLANLQDYKVFDRRGNFKGPQSIVLHGRDVLDAGTEFNDPRGGAAFSTEGGVSRDESRVIRQHRGLDNFVGTRLPTGEKLITAFGRHTPLVRITIGLA